MGRLHSVRESWIARLFGNGGERLIHSDSSIYQALNTINERRWRDRNPVSAKAGRLA